MKITDSKPIGGVRGVATAATAKVRAGQTAALNGPGDSASIMGIPEAEFTPKVRDAIMNLMQEVDRFRQELERAKNRIDHLEKLAENDALTPVLNRRGFIREMTRVKSFVDRYNTPAALVFFDLNNFKPVNDMFGHAAGDEVLQRVAAVLVDNTRDSDVVGRLGGDEFGVILAQADDRQAREKAAQLARAVAARPLEWEGKQIKIEVAYGVYNFKPGENATEALAAADREMYAHKKTLKNGAAG